MNERILTRREVLERAGIVAAGWLIGTRDFDKRESFAADIIEEAYRIAISRGIDFSFDSADELDNLGPEILRAALDANIEPNPSFQRKERTISFSDLWKPEDWEKVIKLPGFEDYVQNSKAKSGGKCVKAGIFNRFNNCDLFSGGWVNEDPIKIDPNGVYVGAFWAKFEPFGKLHEDVRPRMSVIALDKNAETIKEIRYAPNLKSVKVWERYQFALGRFGTPRDLPSNTYAVFTRFDAVGTADAETCKVASFRGDLFVDNVSLRKVA